MLQQIIRDIFQFLQKNPDIPVLNRNVEELLQQQKLPSEYESQLSELNRDIINHNKSLSVRYTTKILEKFGMLDNIQSEIYEKLSQGYILVGYKGVNNARADRIFDLDLNYKSTEKAPTAAGASRGEGFYTTPLFSMALEFAQSSVIGEPPEPPLRTDQIGLVKYRKEVKAFEERQSSIANTDEWKDHAIIIRIYVKDFFAMHGLILEDQKEPLPDNWETFDYIEGIMQGGGQNAWETKFNKRANIYSDITVCIQPRSDSCPDLPLGCIKMLQETSEAIAAENQMDTRRYQALIDSHEKLFSELKSSLQFVSMEAETRGDPPKFISQ